MLFYDKYNKKYIILCIFGNKYLLIFGSIMVYYKLI